MSKTGNELRKELVNKEINFLDLDEIMIERGYDSVFDIWNMKKDKTVTYTKGDDTCRVVIYFEITTDNEPNEIEENFELKVLKFEELKIYVGRKWGTLTEEEKLELLSNANCVDGATGNDLKGDGECIVDLTATLSVSGERKDEEIVIQDEAIIYNPEEGIII